MAAHSQDMNTGTDRAKKHIDLRQQCVLVSSNMAGGRLFPVALAPDPVGL